MRKSENMEGTQWFFSIAAELFTNSQGVKSQRNNKDDCGLEQ